MTVELLGQLDRCMKFPLCKRSKLSPSQLTATWCWGCYRINTGLAYATWLRLLEDQTVVPLNFTHPSKYMPPSICPWVWECSDPDLAFPAALQQLGPISHSRQWPECNLKLIYRIQPGPLLWISSALRKSALVFRATGNQGAKTDSISLLHCLETS